MSGKNPQADLASLSFAFYSQLMPALQRYQHKLRYGYKLRGNDPLLSSSPSRRTYHSSTNLPDHSRQPLIMPQHAPHAKSIAFIRKAYLPDHAIGVRQRTACFTGVFARDTYLIYSNLLCSSLIRDFTTGWQASPEVARARSKATRACSSPESCPASVRWTRLCSRPSASGSTRARLCSVRCTSLWSPCASVKYTCTAHNNPLLFFA